MDTETLIRHDIFSRNPELARTDRMGRALCLAAGATVVGLASFSGAIFFFNKYLACESSPATISTITSTQTFEDCKKSLDWTIGLAISTLCCSGCYCLGCIRLIQDCSNSNR